MDFKIGTNRGGISAKMALRLARLYAARGRDPVALFATAGLKLAELEQTPGRVSYVQMATLIEAVAQELGAADLGWALARTPNEEAYGAAGLLLLTSPNLREGLARAFRYQRLWGDGERFQLRMLDAGCAVTFQHPGPSARAAAVCAECALVEVHEAARVLVDAQAIPLWVRFSHPALSESRQLAEYFGVVPEYSCTETQIGFSADIAERPLHLIAERLLPALEQQCRKALELLPERASLVESVRHVITNTLAKPLSLGAVAQRLHMSARTLQRKLQADGVTYQGLVDAARRKRAQELRAQGNLAKQTAERLGYADPSALTRAQRRWSSARTKPKS